MEQLKVSFIIYIYMFYSICWKWCGKTALLLDLRWIYVKIPFFHRRGEPSAKAMNLSPYWVEYFASSPYTLTGKLPFAGCSRIQLATELQWRQYFLGRNDFMNICMGFCRQLGWVFFEYCRATKTIQANIIPIKRLAWHYKVLNLRSWYVDPLCIPQILQQFMWIIHGQVPLHNDIGVWFRVDRACHPSQINW